MTKRVTIIEDSKETQRQFLDSIPKNTEIVEMQAVMVEPFFNEVIEEAIRDFNPRLIILDLRLDRTEESGFRVLRKLKQSTLKNVPVIVCSKYIGPSETDQNRAKAIEYGAIAAFPKFPFPALQEFFDTVASYEQGNKTILVNAIEQADE